MKPYCVCVHSLLLQINIPSDISQKAVRGANKYLQGKEVNQTLFDEAQYAVFKNLLPYWAGFMKSFKTPTDDKKTPCECYTCRVCA